MDLANNMITLREGKTPRECLIPTGLAEHLAELRPESGQGRVLPVTHGTAVSNFGQALRDLPWQDLGVRRFTSHGIRRMSVDRMYASGADVGAVAAQLGQSPQVALQYYRQASHADRRRAIALAGMGRRPKDATKVVPFRKARGSEDEP